MVHFAGRPGGTESERFIIVSVVVIVARGVRDAVEVCSWGSVENHSSRRPAFVVFGMRRFDLRSGEKRCARFS